MKKRGDKKRHGRAASPVQTSSGHDTRTAQSNTAPPNTAQPNNMPPHNTTPNNGPANHGPANHGPANHGPHAHEAHSESATAVASAIPAMSGAPMVTSFPILLAHFTWYMLGPLFLFLMLLGILRAGTGWVTALDAAFFIVLALTLLCRFLEQRSGQAVGMSGEPSTWADFRRYAVGLPLLAIALWIAANILGNHWFQGNAGF